MRRRSFTVTAERGRGPWWVTECAETGSVSQVRRLDQVADDMREAISYQTGLPEDAFDIEVVPVLPQSYIEAASTMTEQRQEAARAQRGAADAARVAARALRAAGLTLRDIGTVMGVSYQRAAQLTE